MGQYDALFFEFPREATRCGDFMTPCQAYFRGERSIPGAGLYLPYRAFLTPGVIDGAPHLHRDEEYLAFVGADLRDPFASFDAEIELWLGNSPAEMEKIVITAPAMVRIPPFFWHGPLAIRRLGKPLFFQPVLFSGRYYAVHQAWDARAGRTVFPTVTEGMSPCTLHPDRKCGFCGECRGDAAAPYVDFSGTYGSANTGAFADLVHVFRKDPTNWGDFLPPYQAYFRGSDSLPNASLYTCYRPYMKDIFLDRDPNFHTEEEYLCFIGADMTDPFGSFEGEIEFWIGRELRGLERHIITKPTMVRVPPFYWHCPLQFRNLKKPVYLQVLGTRGQYGTFVPKAGPEGRWEIAYSGAVGNKMCVYEPTKRCNVCGKCFVAARKTENLPETPEESVARYADCDL